MPVVWATGDLTLVSNGGVSATLVDLDSVLVDEHPLKEKTAGRITQQKTVFRHFVIVVYPLSKLKLIQQSSYFLEFPN